MSYLWPNSSPYGAPPPPNFLPPPSNFNVPPPNFAQPPPPNFGPPPPNFGAPPPTFAPPGFAQPPTHLAVPPPPNFSQFNAAPICAPSFPQQTGNVPTQPYTPCGEYNPNANLPRPSPRRRPARRRSLPLKEEVKKPEVTNPKEDGKKPSKKDESENKGDASRRDLEIGRAILTKLGRTLPGESKEEIERWVAERKRNWPSRANVERKLRERREREKGGDIVDGLGMIGGYASSEEEKKGRKGKHGGIKKGKRGRMKKKQQVEIPKRRNLLQMLLQDEIQKETRLLLQAIRHIVSNNAIKQ